MLQIRATSISSYYACPYKFKNDTYGIDPKATYLGDIIHLYSREQEDMIDPLVDFYLENIDGDIKTRKIIEGIKKLIIQYKLQLKEDNNLIQEVKLIYPIKEGDEDIWIEGTQDLLAKNKKTGEYMTVDWKTSNSLSRYKDIFETSLQSEIYSYLCMKYYKIDKWKFKYIVFEKGSNLNVGEYEKKYELETLEKKIKKIIMEYSDSVKNNDYKPRQNKLCFFCKLKNEICPLYIRKTKIESIEEIIIDENDDLFN